MNEAALEGGTFGEILVEMQPLPNSATGKTFAKPGVNDHIRVSSRNAIAITV